MSYGLVCLALTDLPLLKAAFEEFGVMPEVIRAIEEMGWELPTPVQAETIPLILGGGDVSCAAETGSGKTGAFGLPILQIVHETLRGTLHSSTQSTGTIRLNIDDRDPAMALSEDGLVCQARQEFAWAGCRATIGVYRGRYYFECTVEDEGLGRIGWATIAGSLDVGTDNQSFGFGGTGKKSHARQFTTYGQPYGQNDVIGSYLDFEHGVLGFTKNGKDLGVAFELPPNLQSAVLFPVVCLKNAQMRFNFGASPFQFTGVTGLQNAPSSDTSVCAPTPDKGLNRKKPLALILEPSRDLAEQTQQEILKFRKFLSAPVVQEALFVGGVPVNQQLRILNQGVDISVGTPGRLADLIETGKMDISSVRFFVLDEADRLLDTGNHDTIMNIFGRLRKSKLQVMLFSATLHTPEIRTLSEKIQRHPTWVDMKGKESVPETVHHALVRIEPGTCQALFAQIPPDFTDGVHERDNLTHSETPAYQSELVKRAKWRYVVRLIEANQMEQALIFVRTKVDADNLEAYLNHLSGGRKFSGKAEKGLEGLFSCVVLHGDRSVPERRENLQSFKDGDVRFLICTDVAARGMDIVGLPCVINVTLPDKSEDYIHRVGRVGRADCMGLAISLVATVKEKVWYHTCPSKGKKCKNTRLTDEGGCCLWYDEPTLLKEIEARLHQSIPPLKNDLTYQTSMGDAVVYGEKRGDKAAFHTFKMHAEFLQPAVTELSIMERDAQDSYLTLACRKWLVDV